MQNSNISQISTEPSLKTKEIDTAKCNQLRIFLMSSWKNSCLKPFSQGKRQCLVCLMASCCMVNWFLTFSLLLNYYRQKRKVRLRLNRACLTFSWSVKTLTSVLEKLAWNTSCCSQTWISQENIANACIHSSVVFFEKTIAKTSIIPARQNQLIRWSSFNTAPILRNATVMIRKLCFHRIIHQKSFLESRIRSQTTSKSQRRSINRTLWCCWHLLLKCYDKQLIELSSF